MMGRRQGGEAGVAETYTFQDRARPNFVHGARDAGVLHNIIRTKGMLLGGPVAAGRTEGGLTRLMVSLDAVAQPVYDKIRVGADLEVVRRNVFRFLELRQARG